MKIVSWLVLALCLLTACSSTPAKHPSHYTSQVRMTIHADTSFTPHERELIMTAVETMRDQTFDFVEITMIFDLDFDSMDSLKQNKNSNTLVRLLSSNAKGIENNTLGYCTTNFDDLDFVHTARAALIYDRLPGDKVWIHVAMHEMLHMIRLQHIPAPQTIMYATTPVVGNDIITCMTPQDMQELCLTHGCNPAVTKPCKP